MVEVMSIFTDLGQAYSSYLLTLPNWVQIFLNIFLLVLVVVIYAILIWKLYRFIAGKNIIPIIGDANFPENYAKSIFTEINLIYQDVAQPNQAEIAISNCKYYLKDEGTLILAIKSQSINSLQKSEKIYSDDFVRIISPNMDISGVGLTSDQSLQDWKILKPTGPIYVEMNSENKTSPEVQPLEKPVEIKNKAIKKPNKQLHFKQE